MCVFSVVYEFFVRNYVALLCNLATSSADWFVSLEFDGSEVMVFDLRVKLLLHFDDVDLLTLCPGSSGLLWRDWRELQRKSDPSYLFFEMMNDDGRRGNNNNNVAIVL